MTRLLLLTLVAALTLAGCDEVTQDEPGGIVIYDAGPGGGPDAGIRQNRPVMTGEIAPVYGFVAPNAITEYYYLGEVDKVGNGVPVNAIYFFYDEVDRPLFRLAEDGSRLVGWHPVVDVIPTQQGYSPFWRVHKVRVKGIAEEQPLEDLRKLPTTEETCQQNAVCSGGKKCIEEKCRDPIRVGVFDLDGIKSLKTLEESNLVVIQTDTVINCPVVDASATLLKGLSNPDLPFPRVQLWYKRLKAFCYLAEGGKELLWAGAGALPPAKAPPVRDALFIRRELDFGSGPKIPVLAGRYMALTENLPGSKDYSPLVRELTVVVDKDYEFKDIRSVAEARQKGVKVVQTQTLHNLPVRGTIPRCTTDADCAKTGGKVDPPLKCSVEQGYCSPPFSRLYEECRRGVKECDPKGGPDGGRLVCIGWRGREKYFCYHACDSNEKDSNPDPDIDSRCGSVKGFDCYPLRQSDPTRPNGLCILNCNSRVGSKEDKINQCVSPTCGDGKLQLGETCDDGNKVNGDGCNEFCTLSTFTRCDNNSDCKGTKDNPAQQCEAPATGQTNTYCLPSDKEKDERDENDKYRVTCMEYDLCAPPDDRAEWLGKKEENK